LSSNVKLALLSQLANGAKVLGLVTGVSVGVFTGADGLGLVLVGAGSFGVLLQERVFVPVAYTNTRATPGEREVSIEHAVMINVPTFPQEWV
jgi:hypothetical protein